MVQISDLIKKNAARWQGVTISGDHHAIVDKIASRLVEAGAKARYQSVSKVTSVPWFVIAVIHEREASQSWKANLSQGDPWNKVSIHVPQGRGPFGSWEDAAVDALMNCPPHAGKWTDWSVGGSLTILEEYNGLGYAARGRPSPYVWAATDQYVKGKYVADGHYDPNVVDQQIGCAALLKEMETLDGTVRL